VLSSHKSKLAGLPEENGKIAFVSDRDGNQEIYVMNSDGSHQTRLTNNPANDYHPNFSPDGTKIAFTSEREGSEAIYVMDADGSNQIKLTANVTPPAFSSQPCYSPDGKKITFASLREGRGGIFVMNADGSNQQRLTSNPLLDQEPSFSPDGKRIAFGSWRDGKQELELYVMGVDGNGLIRLDPDHAGSSPKYTRDGKRVAFVGWGVEDIRLYFLNAKATDGPSLSKSLCSNRVIQSSGCNV
jgi:TolB protein